MHNNSANMRYQNAFQSRKNVAAFGDIRNSKDNRTCDECEDGIPSVFCINCEQYLCKACNLKIHNKGKRSEHLKQQKDLELEQALNVVFLSLNATKEALKSKSEPQETGKKLLIFIRSLLQLNNIPEETTCVYIYYRNEDAPSQDLISEYCDTLNSLPFYAFVDIDKLITVKEVEETLISISSSKNEEKQWQLAKCLSFLARKRPKIYIYDRYDSSKLGSFTASSELLENPRLYILEHQESSLSGDSMKFVELAVKRPVKSLNKDFDYQSLSIYSQETRDFKMSSDSGSELTEKPGFLENNSSCDEVQENGSKNAFKKNILGLFSPNDYSGEEFTLPQVVKKSTITRGLTGGYDPAFQRITDHKPLSQNHSDNSFEGDSHHTGSYFNSINEMRPSSTFSMKEVVPKQGNSNFGLIYHPRKEVEVDGSLELGNELQIELFKLALQGDLMMPKETLIEIIERNISKNFNRKSEIIVDKAHQAGIIRIANRKYPDGTTYNYVSLHLEMVTIESLGWVCRSIKKDSMAPTEKLIISRIKECYDIKVEGNHWTSILGYLENHHHGLKRIFVNESTVILPLILSSITDASTGTETNAVYIKDEQWACEDIGTVDESASTWKLFVKFLDEFFEEEATQSQKKDHKNQNYNSKYPKYGNKYIGYQKYDKKMDSTIDGKAIPGGRYGCAQFLKVCGPEALRKESLGKLNLYVQEAINKGIVRYQRTLLVKNTQIGILEGGSIPSGQAGAANDPFVEKQMRQLKKIKDALIEILYENPDGLSLAQIPQYLRRKLNFSFNLQEMGFPKLKNLLITMTDEIQIDVSGSNHSYAALKNPEKYAHLARKQGHKNYNSHYNYNQDTPVSLFGYKFKSKDDQTANFKGPEPVQKILPKSTNMKTFVNKPISQVQEFQSKKTNDNYTDNYDTDYVSSNDEYLREILSLLEKIINLNPFGLDIIDLQSRLTFELGSLIDLRYLKCDSLVDFLNKYALNLVEIQVIPNQEMRKTLYTVFPKFAYKSLPLNPQIQLPTQQPQNPTQNPNLFNVGISSYFTNSLFQPTSSNYNGLIPGPVNIKANPVQNKTSGTNEKYQPGPFVYFVSQDNPFQFDETPKNNRYYSNLGSAVYESNAFTPQNSQNLNYCSKNNTAPEESNYELTDNFRFIENLLGDSSPNAFNFRSLKGSETSSSVSKTSYPINSNYSYSKNSHSNAVNGEFEADKTVNKIPPGLVPSNKGYNSTSDRI